MYTGNCNGCGACCRSTFIHPTLGVVEAHCSNLLEIGRKNTPGSTFCAVYEARTLGMPIRMVVDAMPTLGWESRCYMSYPQSKDAIPPECSYVFDGNPKDKPRWGIAYRPTLGDLISQK